MSIFSGFRRLRTSGSVNQRSPPPSTSVARPFPPSYRSVFPETTSVRTAQEQISGGAPTESDARSTTKGDTVVDNSDSMEPAPSPTKLYVYYSFFTEDGAIPCKHPVDNEDQYLGRIEARLITPPHTVASVIRCICNVEGVTRHRFVQLLLTASSASPINRMEYVAILTGSGPGSDPQQPLVLVHLDEPLADLYKKAIVAKCDASWSNDDPNWLNYKKGEVVYTDGVKRKETYKGSSEKYYAYHARNVNGRYGFVVPWTFSEPK